ncbi:hypothetical protein ACYCS5_27150 [Paenibacillus sp. SEL3]
MKLDKAVTGADYYLEITFVYKRQTCLWSGALIVN